MEHEIMKENQINPEILKFANRQVFDRWIQEELLPNMAKPTTSIDNLKSILSEALDTEEEVPFITVGCQAMDTVAVGDGQAMSIVTGFGKRTNSRSLRWAQGIAGFQRALLSFGVRSRVFLTLSDIQLLAQQIDNPENADLVDKEIMQENINFMVGVIERHGGNVTPFTHSTLLMRGCGVCSMQELISVLLPEWEGEKLTHTTTGDTTEPLPTALYNADPTLLPTQLLGETTNDLVWLDMMSDLATTDHDQLKASIERSLPNTPLISPTANGGNWSAAGEPVSSFRSKIEFVAALLGIDISDLEDRQAQVLRIQNNVSDKVLVEFLSTLGIEASINDLVTRETTIQSLELVVFGDSQFSIEQIPEVEFNNSRIKDLIMEVGNVHGKQAVIQLGQGIVKVNGNVITDLNFVPQNGDNIAVGRKLKFKLIIMQNV